MLPHVLVIMSVYNDTKYLDSQIDSIFNQRDVITKLYVRDDGSIDETKKILQKNEKKYEGMIHISYENNIGIGNSFMKALYEAGEDFEYFCFADQDDIWLPEKVITAIENIKNITGGVLYCSNQIITNSYLEDHRMRFTSQPDIKFGSILRGNKISGCTFVIDKVMRNFICNEYHRPSAELLRVRIHDVWIAEIAALFGTIIYDNNGYILYRQHGNNAVGAMEYSLFQKIKLKWHYLFSFSNGGEKLALELLKKFDKELGDYKKYLNCYVHYRENIKYKILLIKYANIFKHTHELLAEYILKILIGKL